MSYQYITTEREGRLFVLTINRPGVMNAISPAASDEMAAAMDKFEADNALFGLPEPKIGTAARATKQCVLGGLNYAGVPQAQQAQEAGEFDRLHAMMMSEDIQEEFNAFLEKRKPVWKGR
jgi:enoyl-CoA hydratase/carnithine racemase